MKYSEFGIRTDNLKKGLLPYGVLTVVLSLGLVVSFRFFGQSIMDIYDTLYPVFWISIPISILQEIIFRGFGMYLLKKLFNKAIVIIVLNSTIFSLFHLLTPEGLIFVPVSFVTGLGFAAVYYYYPNLFLVSAVHAIVNLIPVLF
jgi:membrane protease YdiL (CAAX protease family)